MKIERTKNAARNLVFGTFLRGYQIVVPFLMRTVMIRFMGVEYLGLNGLFVSILQVLNLAELGVGSAMVYSMYQAIADDDDERINALMLLYRRYYRAIGFVVLVLGLALAPAIPHLVAKDIPAGVNVTVLYLMNLAATVLSYWLFAYRSSLIQAYQREDVISKATIISSTVQFALQFMAVVVFRDYYLFAAFLLVGQIVTNLLTAWESRRLYPEHAPRGVLSDGEVRDINGRIRDLFTSKLGAVVLDSCDPLVISAFLGLEALAIYQNYYYVVTSLAALFMVFFRSIVAGLGNSLATESEERNYNSFLEVSSLTLCAVSVCVTCMLCLYQPFIRISFGERYLLSSGFVVLYCAFFYVYEICRMLNVFKDASGIWHEDRLRPLVVSLLNIVLNLLLVSRIGMRGVLLSTIISYYFVNLPWLLHNVFSLVFKRGVGEYVVQLLTLTTACVVSGALAWSVCRLLPESGLLAIVSRLVVSLTIGCVVMSTLAWRYGSLGQVLSRVEGLVPQMKRLERAGRSLRDKLSSSSDKVWAVIVFAITALNVRGGYVDHVLPLGVIIVTLSAFTVFLYICRWGFMLSSPVYGCLVAFFALVASSTLASGMATPNQLLSLLLSPFAIATLIEASSGKHLWTTLRVMQLTLAAMVVVDLCTVILVPEGLYQVKPNDIDLFAYYFLGYKSYRTWLQISLIGISSAVSWHERRRVGWETYALWAVSLASTALTQASMGTATLVLMGVLYVLLVLRERVGAAASPVVRRVVLVVSDLRMWSVAFLVVASSLYIPFIREHTMPLISALAHKSPTLTGRAVIWDVSIDLIKQSPFIGHGYIYGSHFIEMTGRGANPHSLYLSLLVSGGVIGTFIITAAFVLLMHEPLSVARDYRSLLMVPLVGILFMGITSTLTFSTWTLPYLVLVWRVVCEGE